MFNLGRRHFSLTLIILAAIMGWWLSQEPEQRLFTPKLELRHEPDYYFDRFRASVAVADGSFRYYMSGAHMAHYPDTNTADIEQAQVIVNAEDGIRWVISALQAQTDQNAGLVQLEGQVAVSRYMGDQTVEDLTLKTESLDIYVDRNFAETEEDVEIIRSSGVTRAHGMHIDFPLRHLFLKSNVRGEYASGI